ncbi:hypothetical protein LTR56_010972 [Elasticomyces elasticus]|nr:hypothetical protein LTR56_010972 [Elasticomyces elasticus]KAK3662670.1 hypothetical protein LTR22_006520 [Elasticomyces elasticus]KAK4926547.1 hypothetical protein LTR49_006481 [Elasticomyces elasticus]KAK5760639.1 hypothetical protein LTS12_009176 [Elasticomyces elasticus]
MSTSVVNRTAPAKKLIVVTAATGYQGAPIVRYLLANHSEQYNVRAINRDVLKPAARALVELGAEVVAADYDNESSLRAAFSGAHVIFANTNYWDTLSYETEVAQGVLIAKVAAAEASLETFIYSGNSDARKLYGGKFQGNLPYNAKAVTLEKVRSQYPDLARKMSIVILGFYHENWLKYQTVFGPVKQSDGSFRMAMPYSDKGYGIPTVSPKDLGVVVAAIIEGGKKFQGKSIALVSENQTDAERLDIWSKKTGANVEFKQVTNSEYQARLEAAGFPRAIAASTTELTAMVGEGGNYLEAEGILKARDIIDPDYHWITFKEYVEAEDWTSIL